MTFSNSRRMTFSNLSIMIFPNSSILTFSNLSIMTFSNSSKITFSNSRRMTFSNLSIMIFSNSSILTINLIYIWLFNLLIGFIKKLTQLNRLGMIGCTFRLSHGEFLDGQNLPLKIVEKINEKNKCRLFHCYSAIYKRKMSVGYRYEQKM